MKRLEIEVPSEERMIGIGRVMAGRLLAGDRIMLRGELGAGKTTLVRGVARGLGFNGRVTSPTFTIMNIYPAALPIYHIDFYRLDGGEKLGQEWEESYYGDGVTMIEWPAEGKADPDDIVVKIDLMNDDYDLPRRLELTVPDSREMLLEGIQTYVDSQH